MGSWAICDDCVQWRGPHVRLCSATVNGWSFTSAFWHVFRFWCLNNWQMDFRPRTHQSRPEQTRPNQTRPNQARPGQGRPDQIRPDQTRPNQIRPNQARPGQNRPVSVGILLTLKLDTHCRNAQGQVLAHSVDTERYRGASAHSI